MTITGPEGVAVYDEALRPQFHFTAKSGWINDPNGLVYYKGVYHLFFQHNPASTAVANMHWGHAVSDDLLHWRQVDNAIAPDEFGTVYSGSAVVDHNNSAGLQKGNEKTLVALYTAAAGRNPESVGKKFTQRMAYSNDAGKTWTKYANNPVLDYIMDENRDPKVVWHAPTGRWVMALYMTGERYALFSSPNLKKWEMIQPEIVIGGVGECPDFFAMPVEDHPGETRWVLTGANGRYLVGTFDGRTFTPQQEAAKSDWGRNFYAVQTFSDMPDGRRVQIAWMNESKFPDMPFSQQLSLPCELTLHKEGERFALRRNPIRELASLRKNTTTKTNIPLDGAANPLADVFAELLDIEVEIELGTAKRIIFDLRGAAVTYDVEKSELFCVQRTADLGPIDGRIHLRLIRDRTSLEVFANAGRRVLTNSALPDPNHTTLSLKAEDGSATVVKLAVSELKSVWR